jgi:hypothetical protein
MRERFLIKIPQLVRDRRMERRIMEYNREEVVYYMVLVGCILFLVSIYY